MIKKLFALLCVFCVILSMCSCARFANETAFSGNITLPGSGIVEKSVFQKLKEENSVATIEGKTNDIKYQWTVFGSDIQNPCSINMKIDAKASSESEQLEIKLHSDKNFGFSPVLSVYVPQKWESATATVFDAKGNALNGASLTSGNPTIVNFTLTADIFEYKINGDGKIYKDLPSETPNTAGTSATATENDVDEYLSQSNQKEISDGKQQGQDKYKTDPVPAGKQEPVEPQDAKVDKEKEYYCFVSIECSTIFNNIEHLKSAKLDILPKDGIILKKTKVKFYDGESVFDVLQRVCKENKIHLEASFTPMYNSAYIEGIGNLYEFDCGELSGWMYKVNGWYPNYGCSRYALCQGDVVEWRFTCDLGRDVGCDWNLEG